MELQHYRARALRPEVPRPSLVSVDPGTFQPNHTITTFLAKISPNPSITPLINGRNKFIATEDAIAIRRVRVERVASNADKVAKGAVCCCAAANKARDGAPPPPGKDRDG